MPQKLTANDVAAYTKGRLSADDPETVRALDAALAKVRRYCGWHVSPVLTETRTFDGGGHLLLFLPTLKLVGVENVVIDGTTIDLDDIKPLSDTPGALQRAARWPRGASNIEVTFTHGYTADEAEDFRGAVLRMIDQASMMTGEDRGAGPLVKKEVDDVAYWWSDRIQQVEIDQQALSGFRLLGL